ncbi:MAG: hypothetical protein AAF533_09625 [Acidobacteriota bacterium]
MERQTIGDATVRFVNQPFTNANGVVGCTFGLSDGAQGVWLDGDVAWLSSSEPDLTEIEDTMGLGDSGEFVISIFTSGQDSLWTRDGLLIVENTQAPGFPTGTTTTFHSGPEMLDDGTIHWVAGFNDEGGTETLGRVLYRLAPGGEPLVVLRSDDVFDDRTISRPGLGLAHHLSGDGRHGIGLVDLVAPSGDEGAVLVDGSLVAVEGQPTGDGTRWLRFDHVAINSSGEYLFTAYTSGPAARNHAIAHGASVAVRKGDTLDGESLEDGMVHDVSVNDLGQAAHVWSTLDGREMLFFAEDVADLSASRLLLATDDTLDVDGDTVDDYRVIGIPAYLVAGPATNLAEDGAVNVFVSLRPIAGGGTRDAIIRLGDTAVPETARLHRATTPDLSTDWPERLGLPLGPDSVLDAGWPMEVPLTGSFDDTDALLRTEPLTLYRLLDASGDEVAPTLRLGRSDDALTLTW